MKAVPHCSPGGPKSRGKWKDRMNYGKYKICMWQMEFRTSVYISRAYMHLDGLMNGPGQDSDLHPTLVLWGNTLQEIGSLETVTQ